MAAPTEMRPLGTLTVQLTGQGYSLSKSYITIGRVQSNDIILNDADVSRQHFSLTWDGQQYVVKDLGSTNGTFVNGQRIGGPQPLRNGDTLQVGGLTLTFRGLGVAVGAGEAQETHIRPSPQPTAPPPPPPPLRLLLVIVLPPPPAPQHSTIIDVTPAGTVNVPLEVKVWFWAKEISTAEFKAAATNSVLMIRPGFFILSAIIIQR